MLWLGDCQIVYFIMRFLLVQYLYCTKY